MDKIKTATGKEFDCDYFTEINNPPRIYIRILNSSVAEVATVFSNPAETVQLWWGNQYLAHYTKVIAIVPEVGAIRVVLGKE